MRKNVLIKWFNMPQEHDYPAADSYLSLIYKKDIVSNSTGEG